MTSCKSYDTSAGTKDIARLESELVTALGFPVSCSYEPSTRKIYTQRPADGNGDPQNFDSGHDATITTVLAAHVVETLGEARVRGNITIQDHCEGLRAAAPYDLGVTWDDGALVTAARVALTAVNDAVDVAGVDAAVTAFIG